MKLELNGTPSDGNMLTDGEDDRHPVLVASGGGPVALVWQHFVDRVGRAEVRTRVLAGPQFQADGGGGGLPDAGFDIEPMIFNTCGCQTGDASALFGLALILLARRRASSRK